MLWIAMFLLLERSCSAAWETIGDWKVLAEDSLSVRRSDGARAWNPAMKLGRSWSVRTDVKIRKTADALVSSAASSWGMSTS